jgi:diaminopimelate epimerase
MTGSGNDFVFFDARAEAAGVLETPSAIAAICDRRHGVGADGVVFLEDDPVGTFGIRYFNRDGTLAELCGNASLCSVSLAVEMRLAARGADFRFGTSSGMLTGRQTADGPEFDLSEVADQNESFAEPLEPGEQRIGFARVGVPHLVVLCADVGRVEVQKRGRALRHHRALPSGANANFVARGQRGWEMRTYERGVEEETLACGTGAVAAASLLAAWGLDRLPVRIVTRSGGVLTVAARAVEGGHLVPTLSGEGRLVFEGVLRDVPYAV